MKDEVYKQLREKATLASDLRDHFMEVDPAVICDLVEEVERARKMERALHAIKRSALGLFFQEKVIRWIDWLEFTGNLLVVGPSLKELLSECDPGIPGLGPTVGWKDPDGGEYD